MQQPDARTGSVTATIAELLATVEPGARPLSEERLGRRVHRVRMHGGRRTSLIVKVVGRAAARKTDLLSHRWLPAVGLGDHGPPLIAGAPGPGGSSWQVFEDLGDSALAPDPRPAGALESATHLVARLHLACADHALLPEWSEQLGELGERFYGNWCEQAACALASIAAPGLSHDRLALRDRISRRVEALLGEEPGRSRRLREVGWPVTLLHGDLWPQNVLLPPGEGGRARLIDWDRSCVGPLVYDLSTFALRLSPRAPTQALRLYEQAVSAVGWRLPGPAELDEAFETAELARLASCLIAPGEAAGEGAAWGFEDLATVEAWFAELQAAPPTRVR